MQLYEIYQNIVIGTSVSCVIGLAVAWVLFLSNRGKDKWQVWRSSLCPSPSSPIGCRGRDPLIEDLLTQTFRTFRNALFPFAQSERNGSWQDDYLVFRETLRIECRVRGFHSHFVYKSLDSFKIIVRHGSLSETASSLRNKKNKSDHQESKCHLSNFPMAPPMQLYEIYQNIALGTSISCVIGLAVAWIFLLSNQNRW